MTYTHYDRYMAGGAVPQTPLTLEAIDPLKAEYFLDRREIGIINVGGHGAVQVDGVKYELGLKDALYIGKDSKEIIFSSADADKPAYFYFNSAPAHCSYPTKKVSLADANKLELGAFETANHRTVSQMIIGSVVTTCQLQMGMTTLKSGRPRHSPTPWDSRWPPGWMSSRMISILSACLAHRGIRCQLPQTPSPISLF